MEKNKSPFISICILAYNRKKEVIEAIKHILRNSYSNFEIILVDNNSTDGTSSFISKLFPQVLCLRNQNEGSAGWNKAVLKAKGKLLLFLDDDSYPAPAALKRIADAFTFRKELEILACRIHNLRQRNSRNLYSFFNIDSLKPQKIYNFTGGGVVMRKETCKKIGYFADWVFYGAHELEFSLRALQKGYDIWYFPTITIYHASSDNVGWRFYFYCTRNHLAIAWIYYPFFYALFFTCYFMFESFRTCLNNHYFDAWWKGIIAWLKLFPLIFKKRKPLSHSVLAPFALNFIYRKIRRV